MKTIYPPSVSWFKLQGRKSCCSVALLAVALLAVTSSLHADYYFQSLDDPQSSVGAANSAVTGVSGSNVAGTYSDGSDNQYSFLFNGNSYLILDDTNAVIPGTLAVGASTAGTVGNYMDSNNLSYGFLTIDGINFTTIDPSGVGLTTIGGISGTTIFGNYGSNSTAFFASVSNPLNSTPVIINGAKQGSVLINGTVPIQGLAYSGQIFGTYADSNDLGFGFITPDGITIQTVEVTNSDGVQSLLGVTSQGLIIGTYEDIHSNSLGFITPDGTSITTIAGPSNAVGGSVILLGSAGNAALGTYTNANNLNAAFLTPDGTNYTILTNGPSNTAISSVIGYLGGFVIGNYNAPLGNTFGFGTVPGGVSVPITGPVNAGWTSLTISSVFESALSGQYNDSLGNPHNFVAFPTTGNSSISVTNYLTVDGPPDSTSITGASGSNSIGFYLDANSVNNWFLSANGYLPINPPGSDPTSIALVGISGNSAVGTYTDTNSGLIYGFTSTNGTNYSTILGPEGTNGGGIGTMDAISGSSIAGTYTETTDPNGNGFTYGYLTQNGGASYTKLTGPAGYDGYSMAITGVSGGTVVGTYSDTNGNTFGFLNSTKVVGPGGVVDGSSTLDTINGIANAQIVGTYSDPISGNTYGFIGTGNTSIEGPYGTNGVGINTVDAISGNLIAGTYTDQNNDPNATNPGTGNLYGYITSDGVHYTTVTGPSDSTGGIVGINFLSGTTVIGTYTDTNSVTHFFAFDGVGYTLLDVPQAQIDPGSGNSLTTVNGISGTTVFGTYTDNFGLTHGFQATLLQNQSISFNTSAPGQTPGTFLLNGSTTSQLPIIYTILSGNSIASISGNTLTFSGAGTATIVATQPGNTRYKAATSATNTLSIAAQTITAFPVIGKQTFGVPFSIVPPTAIPSGLPVKVTVTGGPATIAGNLITPGGVGVGTLTASQSGNASYLPATPVSTTFQIGQAQQTIANFAPVASKTYGNAPFAVTAPNASSGLPVTLSVLSGPATISGNVVTVTNVGTVTLAADQAGNVNIAPASEVTTNFSVNPASQTLSAFNAIPSQVYGVPFSVLIPSSSAGLPVTLSVVSNSATIFSNTVTPTAVGNLVLAANQAGTNTYSAATPVTTLVNVRQAQQILSAFQPISNITNGFSTVQPFSIATNIPTSSNTNNPVLVSVKSGPATIANNVVTVTGNGVITLSASQPASTNYLAATPVAFSFSVGKATQSLSGAFAVSNQIFGTAPFSVTLPISVDSSNNPTGFPVVLSVVSGPATVSGNTVTLTGIGPVTLAATQAGTSTVGPAQVTTAFIVSQGTQTLTAFAPIPNKAYGVPPFNIAPPVASSGLPVTLSVLSGPASISGNTVTVNGAGTVILAADQPGNANYPAAQEVTASFTVNPASQTIGSFAPMPNKAYGVSPFTVTIPTASSGLPVTLSVLSGPATVSGNTVTITGVGTVILAADQGGSANFTPAPEVISSFVVASAPQTLSSFGSIPAQIYGVPFTVTPPASNNTNPVLLSVVAGPGTITGNTVNPTGVGIITIAANQSGNGNYTAAPQVLANVTVNPAPQILSPFPTIANIVGVFTTVPPFAVNPPASTSTNAVIVSVKSGPATIANNVVTVTGNGVITLSASQPASPNYLAATPVTTSFSVGKATQMLSGAFAVNNQVFSTAPFSVTLPISVDASNNPTPLTVTLSVLSGPATVSGNKVTLTGGGAVTLAANQAGNAKYGPAPQLTTTFLVSQASQTINAFAPISSPQPYGASFNVPIPASVDANNNPTKLPVILSVLSGPATLSSSNTVTVNGVGVVTLAADQGGNANFTPASEVTTSFSANRGFQNISFAPIAIRNYAGFPTSFSLNATASSGLPVSYSVTGSNVVSISGNVATIIGGGNASITAIQPGNSNWASATSVSQTLNVIPATQSIPSSWSPPSSMTYSPNLIINLNPPTSSAGLPVALSVISGPFGTSIDGFNNLKVVGAGQIVIAANQIGNGSYFPATQLLRTINVAPASQYLSYFPTIPNFVGDFTLVAPFTVTPPTSTSPNPVNVSVKSGPATITANNVVTLTGNGVVTLMASQPGVANYFSATPVTTSFSVNKADQSLSSFGFIPDQNFALQTLTIPLPTASSGLPVTLSVISGPATKSGTNKVTISGPGVVTLAANQGGNGTYGPAPIVITSFAVNFGSQTIKAFAPISPVSFGAPPFQVPIPASVMTGNNTPTGETVTLSVLSGPATISNGNKVTVNGVGTVTLAANQPGDSFYAPASRVTTSFKVNPANQNITFTPIPTKTYGASSFSLNATASSGLPVTYSAAGTNVVSISGNVVTIIGAGSDTITASQSGNGNWNSATTVIRSITVNPSPQTLMVSVPTNVTYASGATVQLTATSTSGTAVTFTKISGPANLSGNTLTLTGAGTIKLTASVQAGGNYAAASQTVTITAVASRTR